MTTVELRTSIVAELDQMSVEMLESVQHYVRRLRRHARPTRRASATKAEAKAETKESDELLQQRPKPKQRRKNSPRE